MGEIRLDRLEEEEEGKSAQPRLPSNPTEPEFGLGRYANRRGTEAEVGMGFAGPLYSRLSPQPVEQALARPIAGCNLPWRPKARPSNAHWPAGRGRVSLPPYKTSIVSAAGRFAPHPLPPPPRTASPLRANPRAPEQGYHGPSPGTAGVPWTLCTERATGPFSGRPRWLPGGWRLHSDSGSPV